MSYFINHRLTKTNDSFILQLYLEPHLDEFSLEFLGIEKKENKFHESGKLKKSAEDYIREKLPNLKIKAVNIMLGTLLVTYFPVGTLSASAGSTQPYTGQQASSTPQQPTPTSSKNAPIPPQVMPDLLKTVPATSHATPALPQTKLAKSPNATSSYTVKAGDTLNLIAKKFKTTIDYLKSSNGLKSDLINIGKQLKIPYIIPNPSSILALVNKNNKLPSDYIPKNLVIPNVPFSFTEYSDKKLMRKDAASALEEMFKSAKFEGINLCALSGYRSYAKQTAIFSNIKKYGSVEKKNQFSARPGQSEHQTGLAIDLTGPSVNYGLSQAFGDTKEGIWLKKNSFKFGFIIRYPNGKENITMYKYEPWHIRYVGKEAAKEITNLNITLEEYLKNRNPQNNF